MCFTVGLNQLPHSNWSTAHVIWLTHLQLLQVDVAVIALMEIQVLTIPLFICKVHHICEGGRVCGVGCVCGLIMGQVVLAYIYIERERGVYRDMFSYVN